VLDGERTVYAGDAETVLGPGQYVDAPRRAAHLPGLGSGRARMLPAALAVRAA
jgi:uncharacterized cupin superfamily protein